MSPSFRILFALLHFMTSAERPEHKEAALEATTGSKPDHGVMRPVPSKPYKQGSKPDHGLSVRATGGFQSLSHKQKHRSAEARRHDPEGTAPAPSSSSLLQEGLLSVVQDLKSKLMTHMAELAPVADAPVADGNENVMDVNKKAIACLSDFDVTGSAGMPEECKHLATEMEHRVDSAKSCIDSQAYKLFKSDPTTNPLPPDEPCTDHEKRIKTAELFDGFCSHVSSTESLKVPLAEFIAMCAKVTAFTTDLDQYEHLAPGFKPASSNLRAHLTQLKFDSRVKDHAGQSGIPTSLDTVAISKIKADVDLEVGALSDEGVQRQLHGLGMKDQDIAAWIALQASRDDYIAPDDQRGVLDVHGKAMTWDKETGEFKAVGGEGGGEAAPKAAAGKAGARAAEAVADDSSKDEVKTEETLQDAIRQRRIPKVYTALTTYEKHDMAWLHDHVDPKSPTSVNKDERDTANGGAAVLPANVTDTGMYDDLKDKLIEKESLILSQNTEGKDDYSPYEFSVKRFKETGTISWNKNNDYQKALKSYVESLFHMSAGAADITKKEYAVHTRNSAELTKRIEEADLKSYKTEQDKPQGWDCPPGSTNCGNSFFKEHCQNLGKDQAAIKACEENFDTLCTGEGDGDSYATCNQFKQWLMSAQTASGSLTLTLESAQQSCKADATCMEQLKTEFDKCIDKFSIGFNTSERLDLDKHKEQQKACEDNIKGIQGPWLATADFRSMYHDHCKAFAADEASIDNCETELNSICDTKLFNDQGAPIIALEKCNEVKAWMEHVQKTHSEANKDLKVTVEQMEEQCKGQADAEECKKWMQKEFDKCIEPLQKVVMEHTMGAAGVSLTPEDLSKTNQVCTDNISNGFEDRWLST